MKIRGAQSTVSGNYDHTSELIQAADGFYVQWHALIGSQESTAPLSWRAFRAQVKELHARLQTCKLSERPSGVSPVTSPNATPYNNGLGGNARSPAAGVGGMGVMSPSAGMAAGAVISPASLFLSPAGAAATGGGGGARPLSVVNGAAPISTSALLRMGALPAAPLLLPSSTPASLDHLLWDVVVFLPHHLRHSSIMGVAW